MLVSPGMVTVREGTVYVPVVNIGGTMVYLHPRCPLGVLSQAQIVSLPKGISTVIQEPSPVTARLSSHDALGSSVREQIRSLYLSSLPLLEQDKVGVMLFSDGDLDHTSLVTHDLLLLDDVPMRQRYRHMPPSNYDDVRARICQLLESTVIREWQPVCLSHRPSS